MYDGTILEPRRESAQQVLLAAFVIGATALCGGCAPSVQEWSALNRLPAGAAREARRVELVQRQATESGWWDFAEMAGTLAGGFLPGAGLAVAALRRARAAGQARDRHVATALTLTANLGDALAEVPVERRAPVVERIKKAQTSAGHREIIRGYLRRQEEMPA